MMTSIFYPRVKKGTFFASHKWDDAPSWEPDEDRTLEEQRYKLNTTVELLIKKGNLRQ